MLKTILMASACIMVASSAYAGAQLRNPDGSVSPVVGLEDGSGNIASLSSPFPVTLLGSANAGIVPVASSALESGHVLKAGAGSLYELDAMSTSLSGMVLVFDAASVPADGSVTPVKAYNLPAGNTLVIGFDPPLGFANGIAVAFSSASTPFTKTASSTAYFSGEVK